MKYNEIDLLEDINNRIDEELGISQSVKDEAKIVCDKILDSIKQTQQKNIIGDGVGQKVGFLKVEIFNNVDNRNVPPTTLSISWDYLNFRDNLYKNEYFKKNGEIYGGAESVFNRGPSIETQKSGRAMMNITIISVSDHIDNNSLYDSVDHELRHLYEQIMMQRRFPQEEMNVILSNLNNDDYIKRLVANFLYDTDQSEVRGMIQGMYTFVEKERYHNGCDYAIQQSDPTRKLGYAKKYLGEILNTPKDVLCKALLDYGIDYDDFIGGLKTRYDYFLRKYSKAIIKCKQDLLTEGYRYDRKTPFYHLRTYHIPTGIFNNNYIR